MINWLHLHYIACSESDLQNYLSSLHLILFTVTHVITIVITFSSTWVIISNKYFYFHLSPVFGYSTYLCAQQDR